MTRNFLCDTCKIFVILFRKPEKKSKKKSKGKLKDKTKHKVGGNQLVSLIKMCICLIPRIWKQYYFRQ